MSRTLPLARQALVAAIQRDTPGTDLPRYTAVLDALINWSTARPNHLVFRTSGTRTDVVGFNRVKTKETFWSVQVARGTGPKLEIHLAAGRPLGSQDRATVMETLNAHSREVLVEGDRLRIGFGALKNAAALAAVLALLERLLVEPAPAQTGAQAGAQASAEQSAESSTA